MNISEEISSSIVNATGSLLIPASVKLASNMRREFNKQFFATYGSVEQGALAIGLSKPTMENLLRGREVRRSTLLQVLGSFGIVAVADRMKYIDFDGQAKAQPGVNVEVPTDLRQASYDDILIRLSRWKEQGKVVIFTEHITGICLSISEALTTKTFKVDPRKAMINQSYIRVWQASGSLEEYFKLINHVEQDGFVPGYVHHMVRPDGVLEECCSDFYLVNWMGKQVRIGVRDVGSRRDLKQIMTPEKAIAAYPALQV